MPEVQKVKCFFKYLLVEREGAVEDSVVHQTWSCVHVSAVGSKLSHTRWTSVS